MKYTKTTLWCVWLTLITVQVGESQKPISPHPPKNIVQQALRFANGQQISFQGRIKKAWQECYMFTGEVGYIYVDAVTGQVTAAFYKLSTPSKEKQIDLEEAEKTVKLWLKEKGVTLDGWILEERKVYDRGDVGKEYKFHWAKRSPKGVRLPCVLWVNIRGDGTISSFLRIERNTEVSLEPSIRMEEAMKIAIKAAGLSQAKLTRKELFVWFNEKGQQELWWEIELQGNASQRTVIINADTGEVIAVFQPKGITGEALREKVLGILNDLKQITRVEIIGYGPSVGMPLASPTKTAGAAIIKVIDSRKDPKTFQELLGEIKTMVKNARSFGLKLAVPLWLRLHSRDRKWIYHCRFHPKEDYFEFYTKEPWPQKLEGKVVKIIRKRGSTTYVYDWPPEGTVQIGISCQATHRFRDIILKSIPQKVRRALEKK